MNKQEQAAFDELNEALKSEKEISESKDAIIEELSAKITALTATGNTATVAVVELPTTELNGKKYKFLQRNFVIAGDPCKYNADEAVNNVEVLNKILSLENQLILQELVD